MSHVVCFGIAIINTQMNWQFSPFCNIFDLSCYRKNAASTWSNATQRLVTFWFWVFQNVTYIGYGINYGCWSQDTGPNNINQKRSVRKIWHNIYRTLWNQNHRNLMWSRNCEKIRLNSKGISAHVANWLHGLAATNTLHSYIGEFTFSSID